MNTVVAAKFDRTSVVLLVSVALVLLLSLLFTVTASIVASVDSASAGVVSGGAESGQASTVTVLASGGTVGGVGGNY